MPVEIFVGHNPEGQTLSPDYSHEMTSLIEIVKRLWGAFHHHPAYYAVVANLAEHSADMLIISERGIGVMELKHYYGRISCRTDGGWYAGPKRMIAGVEGRGFKNPHEQVQSYAEHIRQKLIEPPLWQEPWLPGKTIEWPEFKFHTAVCFTHPDADLSEFDEQLRKRCRPITLPWEDFSVLTIDEVPRWAISLRFEAGGERASGFNRYRLTAAQIQRFLGGVFDLAPWSEIEELMPTGEPYAYLTFIEKERELQVFGLDHDVITLGRDPSSCEISLPERLFLVSRNHARIFRTVEGVFIEDLNSTNGTFVDGKRVFKRTKVEQGQRIILGRVRPNEGAAEFEVSFEVEGVSALEATRKLSVGQEKK